MSQVLSLKSIYKILTENDYPVYSGKVISKEHHKGLTLMQFWQDVIIPEWKETPTGSKIWRLEGGRNRYTSEVCNRSERYHFYEEYISEIAAVLIPDILFQQIIRFMNMLDERDYNYKFLVYRMKAAIKCYVKEDVAFDKDSYVYFSNLLGEEDYFRNLGPFGRTYFCSYLLTMLMLHGLGGNGEGQLVLNDIRHKVGCDIKLIYYYADTKRQMLEADTPGKQQIVLRRCEAELRARECLCNLIAVYQQVQELEKVELIKDTMAQLNLL